MACISSPASGSRPLNTQHWRRGLQIGHRTRLVYLRPKVRVNVLAGNDAPDEDESPIAREEQEEEERRLDREAWNTMGDGMSAAIVKVTEDMKEATRFDREERKALRKTLNDSSNKLFFAIFALLAVEILSPVLERIAVHFFPKRTTTTTNNLKKIYFSLHLKSRSAITVTTFLFCFS